MPTGITRSQFQRVFFPGLRDVIGLSYQMKAEQFSTIYNIMTSDSAFEEDYHIAGVGLAQLTDEDTEIPKDQFYRGPSIRYNHADFTLGIGFSHQFQRDVKINIMNERAKALGTSFRQTPEVLVADDFNNGFTVYTPATEPYGAALGYDNVALFSASHPLIRGGGSSGQVQSNVLATPSTLSVSSYRDMLTLSRLLFDDTGVLRIQLTMKDLVVPPQLEFVAKEIVKSAGRPDTANRADNVNKDATGIIIWDFLLNAKYWYMVADKSMHKLKFYWREKFGMRTWMDDNTETHWIRGREAFSHGYSDYIGVFGTNPT
jgi:hypothetical protein